jgi:DNA-binding CsgD family transcriptional regulator
VESAAELLGVSRSTARTHLKRIFSKTGVGRQTELIRLVINSTAPLLKL